MENEYESRLILDVGAQFRPFPGEITSGDRCFALTNRDRALLAVIDGSGHGREATQAAEIAEEALKERAGMPLERLLRHCHERLASTRGASVTLATVDARLGLLRWAGVGDVEAMALHWNKGAIDPVGTLISERGVIGYRLPKSIQVSARPIARGDLIVMTTDGIDPGFRSELIATPELASLSSIEIARAVLEKHGKSSDDALILVARVIALNSEAGQRGAA
ncbi:MAG: serine/threonine-protein phosphatase [Oligoflexia bacterium]|nr:serine/threonine-protein phosphatase [Oligoflexia bacterium]